MTKVPDHKIKDENNNPVHPYGGVGQNESFFAGLGYAYGSQAMLTPYISLTRKNSKKKQ